MNAEYSGDKHFLIGSFEPLQLCIVLPSILAEQIFTISGYNFNKRSNLMDFSPV